MKIITFGTLKGGVGKTMLCFNIGGILAQNGKKVLVIDSDLQGNLTNNMGIDRTIQICLPPMIFTVWTTRRPIRNL